MAYAIPTDEERPILFRWLKQQSSYTIWRQIGAYMDSWVDEAKRIAQLTADPISGEMALNESELRLLIQCRAAFVDALATLKAGDQAVFKWLGWGTGHGYFCEAGRAIDVWNTKLARIEEGLALADTEYWPTFKRYFDALVLAWSNGGYALESRHTDVPAPLDDMRWLRGTYEVFDGDEAAKPHPSYEQVRQRAASLPPVPTPHEETLIKTGDAIPCFGIWEPVKLSVTRGFAGLFQKPLAPSDGKFELDGCMNYLHAGSPAPTIGYAEDNSRGEGRATVWRLLWRDERYKDGQIPDEEMNYVFASPPDQVAARAPADHAVSDLVVAPSGTPAPCDGVWAAKETLGVRVRVARHAPLPQLDGRDIEWVHVPGV